MHSEPDISGLWCKARTGDRDAFDQIVPLVYEELRILAHAKLTSERSDHTLNTTALVHEAYLRLLDVRDVDFRDRAHFLALASRMMRRVLVDYARRRAAAKRGGGWVKLEFQDERVLTEPSAVAVEELDRALTLLEEVSPRRSQLLEQRYFGGLKLEECAEALGISLATVKRELRSARAWLASVLFPEVAGAADSDVSP
ncbi:MAG: ECF-type sigma factor [Gemmatimonadota bacterium]